MNSHLRTQHWRFAIASAPCRVSAALCTPDGPHGRILIRLQARHRLPGAPARTCVDSLLAPQPCLPGFCSPPFVQEYGNRGIQSP